MLTICYKDLHFRRSLDSRLAYVTDTMIPFSKWLYSVQSSCLGYQCIGVSFQNRGGAGDKIPKHKVTWSKNCFISPRFRAFQICMRRRSEEDISFKSFKKWQTCWGLNFACYCFQFSKLFRLISIFLNMFLIQVFRAHQKETVSISLVYVDMTPE